MAQMKHLDALFLKNDILPSKKSVPFLQFFQIFFLKWYIKRGKFFCIELSGSSHFIQAFKHHMSMNSSKKNQKNYKKGSNFFVVKSHFLKNSPSKWVLFFCVAISASIRFIWAIKQHYPMIFHFPFSKDWFRGGLSATPRGWTGQRRFSNCFCGPYGIPNTYKCQAKKFQTLVNRHRHNQRGLPRLVFKGYPSD